MAFTYGTTRVVEPIPLSQSAVGYRTGMIEHNLPWWYKFVQTLINVVQVGISFVPGVGFAASTAIEVGLAAGQTALEATVTGKVDPLGAVFNFGMPVIGTGIKAVSGIRQIAKTTETVASRAVSLENRVRGIYRDVEEGLTMSSVERKSWVDLVKERDAYSAMAGKFSTERPGVMDWFSPDRYLDKGISAARESFDKTLGAIRSNLSGSDNFMRTLEKSFADKLRTLETNIIKASTGSVRGAEEAIQEERVMKAIGKEFGLSYAEISQLRKLLSGSGSIINEKEFAKILMASFRRTGNEFVGYALNGGTKRIIKQLMRNETTAARLSNVAAKVVRTSTKALSLATSPARVLKRIIGRTFDKIEEAAVDAAKTARLKSIANKAMKAARKAEETFAKTGGVMMNSSVIMGYKVIMNEIEWKTLLIKFRPEATNAKKGKNQGGKKDVIVKTDEATFIQFTKAKSPMGFYLDTWAKSRGGRTVAENNAFANIAIPLDTIGISTDMVDVLGFLPIKQIRPYLALASQAKRLATTKDVHWIWQKEFFGKLREEFNLELAHSAVDAGVHLMPHQVGRYVKRFADTAIDRGDFTKLPSTLVQSAANRMRTRRHGRNVQKVKTVSMIGIRGVKLV